MGQFELLLAVWVTIVSMVASDVPGGYYQTKYESLDVEDVLNHKRLVHHYAACLLNRGPCPPQGTDLKRILPESIETTCLRCTEKQKIIILKTIRRLRSEYPRLWKELVDYYDPTEEKIRRVEFAIDKEFTGDDASNFIGNRFAESDSGNDLAAPVKPEGSTYLPPPSSSVTPSPPTQGLPYPASSSATPKSTTIAVNVAGSTAKPLSFSPSNNVDTVEVSTTKRPSVLTRWRQTTVPDNGAPYGWRPNHATLQPFNIPLIKVDAGIRFLDSIGNLGSKVLQAGGEVASMVLSTVQQVFGGQPVH